MSGSVHWVDIARGIEALEDLALDPQLVADFQRAANARDDRTPRLAFHVPSFKHYESAQIAGCGKGRWPAVSVTGGQCRLQCDHCKAKILEPMIPATTPEALWQVANREIAAGASGMLVTGGSNLRDEVEYQRFYPTLRRIKDRFPEFRIAMHTALISADGADSMAQAGIDVAMLDIIGAQDTVTQVYHLKRPVSDFEESLSHLMRTPMRVVPHIVIGLHYGRMLGEWQALEMIARHRPHALVLVVVMPHYAPAARPFATPQPRAVGRFMLDARSALPDTALLLGCARPAGHARSAIDTYAVMAGMSGIAHPAEGTVELASRLGYDVSVSPTCCSISVSSHVLGDGALGGAISMRPDDFARPPVAGRAARALRRIRVVTA